MKENNVLLLWFREGKGVGRRWPKQRHFEYWDLFLHAALQLPPLLAALVPESVLWRVSGPKTAWWCSAQSDLITGCWLLLPISTSVTKNTLRNFLKLFFHGSNCSCCFISNYTHDCELEGSIDHKDKGTSAC